MVSLFETIVAGKEEFTNCCTSALDSFLPDFSKGCKEGLASILFEKIKNTILEEKLLEKDPALLEKLKRHYYHTAYRNTLFFEELKKIMKIFDEKKIEAILFKGLYLAYFVYENPALRPLQDIDLLVHSKDVPQIMEIMKGLSYKSNFFGDKTVILPEFSMLNSIFFWKESGDSGDAIRVHIHWHILNASYPQDFFLRFISIEKIWQRSLKKNIDSLSIRILSNEDAVINNCEHSLKHCFENLVGLYDFCFMISKFSENLDFANKLLERVEEFNLETVIYINVRLAREIFNFHISDKILKWYERYRFSILEEKFIKLVLERRFFNAMNLLVYFRLMRFIDCYIFIKKVFLPTRREFSQFELSNKNFLTIMKRFINGMKIFSEFIVKGIS